MILLIIGSVLLLFGILVFFKKNEGETEISLLGAKVKSNNSAILLITLGAVIASIGGSKYMDSTGVKPDRNDKDSIVKYPLNDTGNDSGFHQTGLNQNEVDQRNLLAGSWELSQSLSGEKALLKMFGSSANVPPGINDVIVVVENKASFTRNGDIDFASNLLCQFKDADNNNFDLRLRIAYTGTWQIENDRLQQTIEDGSITPTNDLSRTLFSTNKVALQDFGYAPGTTETYQILYLNESSLTIRDSKTEEKITWSKIH